MTPLDRAAAILLSIGIGGFFWAHFRENKDAEWTFGGIIVAGFIVLLLAMIGG